LGVLASILLPEQRQRHAASLAYGCATNPDRYAALRTRIRQRKQPSLRLLVRDRPAETRHGRTTHVFADCRYRCQIQVGRAPGWAMPSLTLLKAETPWPG
jgi:hypothetical protein